MSKEGSIDVKAKGMAMSVRRISWPTSKKTMKNTGIVLGWTAAVAAIVFVADMVSETGFQMLIHLVP